MSLFNSGNYQDFLQETLRKMPKAGHGQLGKWATSIGVHPTLMSLIVSGKRELSYEQAFSLTQTLGLTSLESEYFQVLVQLNRAGTHEYKKYLQQKLNDLRNQSLNLSKRVGHEKQLNENEKSIFYSSWRYSAIRLFCTVDEDGKSIEAIMEKFDMDRKSVIEILNFLESAGLVGRNKDNYTQGIQRTYLEKGSPHLAKHHMNWRFQALQKADVISDEEMMFTFPMSISRKDFSAIRNDIAEILKKFSQTVKDTDPEDIACLNVDYFWIE